MSKGRQPGATAKKPSVRKTKQTLVDSGAVPMNTEKVYRKRRQLTAAEQGLEEARQYSHWNF